jgi:exosortase B
MNMDATEAQERLTANQAAGDGSKTSHWLLALLGFLLMYAPVYWHASQTHWTREEHAHGPLILLIAAWLIWQLRESISQLPRPQRSGWAGWVWLILGTSIYLLGRALNFSILEFAAQPMVAAGAVLLCAGRRGLQLLWFPLVFLVFTIPLPGSFVDAATGPLKQWVSVCAEHALAWMGYPVGRSGVMLTVGNYQLLVADACSGLHSMFTLAAMGSLVLYLKARSSKLHNLVMLGLIWPIAFAANVIRVLILVLVTYHLGDEAGQGFLHGAAGVVLIVVALLSFIAVDVVLGWRRPELAHQP